MSYLEEDYLLLSGIQHFAFCRRQWALIHIENQWAENLLTVEGSIKHERVHDSSLSESRGDTLTVRALPVKSAALGLSGECDAVVFTCVADGGVYLHGRKGRWSVMPVEYKHGSSKANDCDRLQAVAQAMCLEEMLCCEVPRVALYYFATRCREYVDVTDALRQAVTEMCAEMHEYYRRGYTPRVRPSKQCKQCSLVEECFPRLLQNTVSVDAYVKAHTEEDDE